MEAFTTHAGTVAVLWRENVDTDQIIPKDFLKSIKRTGFGEHLFADWRFHDDGSDDPDFALNRPEFKGATVLLAGNNFGCGSSREHAVWAVRQYGFRVVVAPTKSSAGGAIPGFADIFRNNALKNGLLTVEVSLSDAERIRDEVRCDPALKMTVDLPSQKLNFAGREYPFQIDASSKDKLVRGLDDIGTTFLDEAAIVDFEKRHETQMG